jgi:hypothetical protein
MRFMTLRIYFRSKIYAIFLLCIASLEASRFLCDCKYLTYQVATNDIQAFRL